MPKWFLSIWTPVVVLLVGFSFGLLVSCADPLPVEKGVSLHITGTVTDANTNAPISNASLKLYINLKGGHKEILGSVLSDKDGHYSVKGTHNCDGLPQLRAEAEEYYGWNVAVHCQNGTQTVDFKLKPRT
jgi:hypothetical protein